MLATIWVVLYWSLAAAFLTVSAPERGIVGRSFVVSADGDDQNAGTVPNPWKSLAKAAQGVQPGDTVFVREGVYPAGTVLRRSGERGRPITFRNFPGEHPVINGQGKGRYGIILDGVRFVHVRGFEICEIRTAHPRLRSILHEQGAILLRESSDCLIEGNRIATGGLPGYTEENPGATGIQLWSRNAEKGCHRNVVRGNEVSQCAYGVHVRGPGKNNVFQGNYWHENQEMEEHSDGIKFESIDYDRNHPKGYIKSSADLDNPEWAAHTPRNNVIRYNICKYNSDDGIDTWISVRNVVEHNFCEGSGAGPKKGEGNGFKLGPGGHNVIRFNLSRHNRVKAYTDNGGANNVYENNLALGTKGDGGEGVLGLASEDEWTEKALRRSIEQRILIFHAALVETTPPNPPRGLHRKGGRLSWEPPTPAEDGDKALYYLILSGDQVLGVTSATHWDAPADFTGVLSVVAVDDSYRDNRSAPVQAAPGALRSTKSR